MSLPFVIMAVVFGGAAAAFLPRVGHRLAVPAAQPARTGCAGCGRPFPAGPGGWIRAGPACRCAGRAWPVVTAGAAVAGVLAARVGETPQLPVYLLAGLLGVLLAMIDLRCLRLPDLLVGALAIGAGLPLAALSPQRVGPALAAATAVGLAYLGIALLPRHGLGLGDVKLAAVLAFLLSLAGWPALVTGLCAPHLLNGPVALGLLLSGRAGGGRALPFGPALLAGALLGLAT